MQAGYVKVYRKLASNPIWNDPQKLRLWLYCLMKASYKEHEIIFDNQLITLKAGQFITGRASLEAEYNKELQPKFRVSGKTLWRWLKVLEENGSLSIKSTNKYSIITINNWDEYNYSDQQLSKDFPAVVQQMSTIKKDKKLLKKNNNTTSFDLNALYKKYAEEEVNSYEKK